MTVNLSIKNVPESLAEKLRQRAEANHRSLQGELMALLESAVASAPAIRAVQEPAAYVVSRPAQSAPTTATRTLRQIWEDARQAYQGDTTRSVDLLREAREERDLQLSGHAETSGAHARALALLEVSRPVRSKAAKKVKRA